MSKVPPMPPTSQWVKFKQSLCDSCWANCCHGWPVEVSVQDLIRLGLIDEESAATGLSKAVRKQVAKGMIKKKATPFVYDLGQKKNGDCIYLGADRRCTVYTTRPEICRSFPKIGARPGHCPHVLKK